MKKYEPAHIHVLTDKGKIQFWIPSCKIKKVEGHVNPHEKGKIERIVEENSEFFLKEWEKQKSKKK